jgi:hypothetical protein
LDHIKASSFARVEFIVYNAEEFSRPAAVQRQMFTPAALRRKRFLFELYSHWDRKRIAPARDPYALVDCAERLQQIPSLAVRPIAKALVQDLPSEALDEIRARKLDVLLRFGFKVLGGEILRCARYGVWSYHHGDNDQYRGGPPHFWEVYEDNPVSGVVLQILNDDPDAGKVLCKGLFATERGLSWTRNQVTPGWGATTFVIQKLRELHERGFEDLERRALEPAPYRGKKIYKEPTNWEMVRWLGPAVIRKTLAKPFRKPVVLHWRLATRIGNPLKMGAPPEWSGFRFHESPRGHYYADPFLLHDGERPWLFFEDFDYQKRRGAIACAEVLPEGSLGETRTVLERPYHLSYPCVFRDGGELYMVPESHSNGTVGLYRCTGFPDRWELAKELFRLDAVDSTIWIQDGYYWLFTSLHEKYGHATQLWLFYARDLFGEWRPHPASPLSTDVRRSRNGGAILSNNGRLFRPAQDCSREYGYSFSLNEITKLNPFEYAETPA